MLQAAASPACAPRIDLAAEILADMRRLNEQMLERKKKLASAVPAALRTSHSRT